MDYKEAVKKVAARKNRENYMLIKMGYDNTIVLPHKAGVILLDTLASAEQINEPYGKPHSITELERNKISVTTMSQDEYERYKIAMLLDMTLEEVKLNQLQVS